MTNEIVVNKNTNSKQLKRLILACTLLVSTLLCIFVSGQIQANYDKFNIVLDDLDSSDGDHSNEANVLPTKFEEELFCVDKLMAADIKVSDTKNVIGFVCATNSNFLAESIKSQMQSNGWSLLSSGNDNLFSAQKASGKYRYAYIQLFEIEGNISVVVTLS